MSAPGATKALAEFAAGSRWSDVPEDVRHEGVRAFLNWLGCAIGGCRDDSVERLLDALRVELEAFADAIEDRAEFPVAASDMLATVAAFEAVVKALETGATVEVEETDTRS